MPHKGNRRVSYQMLDPSLSYELTRAYWTMIAGQEMRDYLLIYINGREKRLSGADGFFPLASYLRYQVGATGTKIVCDEGDCGACSVILGNLQNGEMVYRPVNSCIQLMCQLDCTHVVTVEGLKLDGQLNSVQDAMVSFHGTQCGYCTPGFITSMYALFEKKGASSEQDCKDGLTGNLCRCTGYEPIIKAALAVDQNKFVKLNRLYPERNMLDVFARHSGIPIRMETDEHRFFRPTSLREAIDIKMDHPDTVIVAGGTDVCVNWNQRGIQPHNLMTLSGVPDLNELTIAGNSLIVGAQTTLTHLEEFCRDSIPELTRLLWLFGSPQIRNVGTLAGNIANGSPVADTVPFLAVMEAEVELTGHSGVRRVNINQLYSGYKQLAISSDEIITRIFIPLPQPDEIIKLYKVSKRRHLDIATVSAAYRLQLKEGVIAAARVSYGGVAPVVLRLPKVESFLTGASFSRATFVEAADLLGEEITPISDVRGTREFRLRLASNLLLKFYSELAKPREAACQQ